MRLDMTSQIGERSAEADMIVHQHIIRAAPDRPVEQGRSDDALESRRSRMADLVRLHDLAD